MGYVSHLGLTFAQVPLRRSVDLILILGGAKLSGLLRAERAAQLLREGAVGASAVVLLGSNRPVTDAERAATDTYARGAATELDLMVAGAAHAFRATADSEGEAYTDPDSKNRSWSIRHLTPRVPVAGVEDVVAVAAPSTAPDKRPANTADTYAFLAERASLTVGTRILIVTSQVYVGYQHLEAVRNLAIPYDVDLETIGFPSDWHADLQGMQHLSNYLQELRSTIQAARRLYAQHLADVQ